MFVYEQEIETQLDAMDALDQIASTLRGLGFLAVALCECPSKVDDDTFGLIANVVYHCADTAKKVSATLYADLKKSAPRGARQTIEYSKKVLPSCVDRAA